MKLANMKSGLLAAILFGALQVYADAVVVKDLGKSGDWQASEIAHHPLWDKEACVAQTKAAGGVATLELYAEKSGTVYNDPLVEVVTAPGFPFYVRGILTDAKGGNAIHLILATTATGAQQFGLLSRLDQRAAVLNLLKAASGAKVQFINDKNKIVKTLAFSLKGSSKIIATAIQGCQLTVD